jgi:phospholipase C
MGDNASPGGSFSRRGLLKSGLAAGAVLGTGSWQQAGVTSASRRAAAGGLRRPGSLPHPGMAEGTDTLPQIKHVVVLMMENHSYDNHFGMLRRPGADGFTLGPDGLPVQANPYPNGDLQHCFRMPTTCQLPTQPTQSWQDSHIQFDNGGNDGFVRSGSGPVAMGYWQQADLPFYYSLARVFPVADRYFSSVLGPTFPNRRYLIAATSTGKTDNSLPSLTETPPNGTLFDRLNANGISWKNYYSTLATTLLYPPVYFKNYSKIVPVYQFFTDAADGKLPEFSLVEPNYETNSEESPQNIAPGEQFAAQVISAVMHGPQWHGTLLILTFDEHGGYYDHVPPPAALAPDNIPPDVPAGQEYNGFAQYGFRVPCVAVSPWARRRYVSHQVMDHASICALVESKWNLPAMTLRDANAHDMRDMLDLTRPSFRHPPKLAPALLDTDPNALLCNYLGPGTIPPPGSVTQPGS